MQKKVTYTDLEIKSIIEERFFDIYDNVAGEIQWLKSFKDGQMSIRFFKSVVKFTLFVGSYKQGAPDLNSDYQAQVKECLDFVVSYFGFKSYELSDSSAYTSNGKPKAQHYNVRIVK